MKFDIQKKEDFTLIRVNNERLDTNSGPELKTEFVLLSNNGEKNIVLDMSKCIYCDSSGLRAIMVGNRLCEDIIGTFILCGLHPDVENLIRISMLHSVLLITDTSEKAEELLKKKENL